MNLPAASARDLRAPSPPRSARPARSLSLQQEAGKTSQACGEIFFLCGTTTAGKSSIMNAFASAGDSVALGIDEFADERNRQGAIEALLKEHMPSDYRQLAGVLRSDLIARLPFATADVLRDPSPFTATSSTDQQHEVETLLQHSDFFDRFFAMLDTPQIMQAQMLAHFQSILGASQTGKSVIFDSRLAGEFYQYLKAHPQEVPPQVTRVLVYLSPDRLLDRVQRRNEEAEQRQDFGDRRGGRWVLLDFMKRYKIAEEGDIAIDTLSYPAMQVAFDRHREAIADSQEEDIRELFLKHFGLSEQLTQVKIAPPAQS